jgi:hypothetical protein
LRLTPRRDRAGCEAFERDGALGLSHLLSGFEKRGRDDLLHVFFVHEVARHVGEHLCSRFQDDCGDAPRTKHGELAP